MLVYEVPFSFTHHTHSRAYVHERTLMYTFFCSMYVMNVMNINDHQLIKIIVERMSCIQI